MVEHEASTSKIGEDQLFYFQQRGIDPEKVGRARACVGGEGCAPDVHVRAPCTLPPPAALHPCTPHPRSLPQLSTPRFPIIRADARRPTRTHARMHPTHIFPRANARTQAVGAIISGFCREVFNELPLEFAAEVNELMALKMEGTVG